MLIKMPKNDLSFWVATPDERPCLALQASREADVVIVGGGFAGLSAAYHLSQEQSSRGIILLEAGVVGSGASGRNTGMLGPRVGGSLVELSHRYGESEAKRLYQASIDAVNTVKTLIRRENLACALEETAQVKVAQTVAQVQALQTEARLLEKLGFDAPYWTAAELVACAPVAYRGGLGYPQSALLNPVRLCRELKRILLARGVQIYENTPVSSIHPGQPLRLETAAGTITARQVVLATNAYTAQLGLLRGQVIPIQTHVIVTEPLCEAQLAGLHWPGRQAFFEMNKIFNYYRLTPDNRIMFGGGRPLYQPDASDRRAGATDLADPAVWTGQVRSFARRFPSVASLPIAKRWSGTVGMTLDELPLVGEVAGAPGIFFAGGWNGHGVALATASGATITDLLLGRVTARLAFPWVRGQAMRIPADPVRAVGLSLYLTSLRARDRLGSLRDQWFHSHSRVDDGVRGDRTTDAQEGADRFVVR